MTMPSVKKLLDIGIALSGEKNADRLLEIILESAMDVTECDGGTLYVREGEMLHYKLSFTKSLGRRDGAGGRKIRLKPIAMKPRYVSGFVALDNSPVNIPDIYENGIYDFQGPKKFDEKHKYRTVSMLTVPMNDEHGEVIGVLQLINAQDAMKNKIPFAPQYVDVVRSLASQAAICLTIRQRAQEVEALLDSFVKVMSTAINKRTPYNLTHTRQMNRYAEKFIEWLNSNEKEKFDGNRRQQFLMAVWLHDIGKLLTPMEIMNKPGRLTVPERMIMETHVTDTRDLLSEMQFPARYQSVPGWASSHHEFLNGTGYPDGLKDSAIPFEVRVLTILDIYDSLTADDRPYKRPHTVEDAFGILDGDAKAGKIDAEILGWFKQSGAWKCKIEITEE